MFVNCTRDLRRLGGTALLLCAAGAHTSASSATDLEEARRLTVEVTQALRDGDFETVWNSENRLTELMLVSVEVQDIRRTHCRDSSCPDLGKIAWVLGKSKSDLNFLAFFCLGDQQQLNFDETLCDPWLTWVRNSQAHLGDSASPPANVTQEIQFEFIWANSGYFRPWIVVGVGDKQLWAMIDTASTDIAFHPDSTHLSATDYERVGEPFLAPRINGLAHVGTKANLFDVTLGAVTEVRVPATIWDYYEDMEYLSLGMNILLRYPAVCFSWRDLTLHLGQIGPCVAGEMPFEAELHSAGMPVIQVPALDGTWLPAVIDTGAVGVHCQDQFMEDIGGQLFRFGESAELEAECGPYNFIEAAAENPDPMFQAVIGTDALLQFDAFGWELNPLRMYFVPKQTPEG